MTRSEIFDKISQMIKEQMHHEDMEVTEETSLKDELGVDSIDLMEFVVNLEDEFSIEIPDDDIETIEQLGDMLDYLEGRLVK
ncbi:MULTISPECIES: acyl carrier protein [Bacteria]|uniref:Acyl carrier protein n=1 Tax=Streptococcus sobrinus TaxID=1310 RepID=A0ABM6W3Z9_9STRE|nr:acyl carrier protein [Streptococcus sobrinus]AWN17987.1 acyl carrier protein [Streptococcus sobrinus]AWN19892.1 acyl carrier protein [Streptococcus sobrinus]EMP72788.1 acyl carrier protein [Streptococcus sobrinus DSM 20742 = ATCC 33478]OZV21716.1 acyl carrier protein [Streptococcus sobrinus]SQG12586.1 acyl carrier protein [Streptococcus sobrinus]